MIEPGYYAIFTKLGGNMCVGVDSENNCVLTALVQDDSIAWVPQAISGTNMFYLMHQKTGLCARFTFNSQQNLTFVTAAPLYSTDDDFVMAVADLGWGYIAINNISSSQVWDAAGGSNAPGTSICGYDWRNSTNQSWRLVPTSVLV